ncbi:sulfatase-like hydrolase/transferase [bacterium]|nr:sulfatase-like hydrolase/transferase [bacterium]
MRFLFRFRSLSVQWGLLAAIMLHIGRTQVSAVSCPTDHSTILITIDTLRVDHIGTYGFPIARTPCLDLLSKSGWTWTEVMTDVPLTLPAHCSLLTGLPVSRHGVRTNLGYTLAPEYETLATRFRQAGFRTAAFIGGYPLLARFGLDRGFDTYDDHLTRSDGTNTLMLERPAFELVGAAQAWLERNPGPQPWFIWLHFYDPHTPYDPPGTFAAMFEHKYDGEIAYTDAALTKLFRYVRKYFPSESRPRLIVTADHGEALGDHREQTHGLLLYQATLSIPLIINWEGTCPPALIMNTQNALTIYQVHDLIFETRKDKAELAEYPLTEGHGDPPFYFESCHAFEKYRWSPISGIRQGQWKLHAGPRIELYDLEHDPQEQHDLAVVNHDQVAVMTGLHASLSGTSATLQQKTIIESDQEVLSALEALGYIVNTQSTGQHQDRPPIDLPDPKERIICLDDIEHGSELVRQNKFSQAKAYLEKARQCDPTNPDVRNDLGLVYQNADNFRDAARMFAQAVELAPDNARYHNNYGSALKKVQDYEQAQLHFQRACLLDPHFLPAKLNLAILYYETDRKELACHLIKTVLGINPDWSEARHIATQMECQCH